MALVVAAAARQTIAARIRMRFFFGLYKNSQVDYSTEKVDSDKGTSDLLFSSEIDEEGSNRVELLSL